MIDYFIDTLFDENSDPEEKAISPVNKKNTAPRPEFSLEEQAFTALELAHSVSALHNSPHPLALMKVLGSLDSNFLSDSQHKDPERLLAETLLGIFL